MPHIVLGLPQEFDSEILHICILFGWKKKQMYAKDKSELSEALLIKTCAKKKPKQKTQKCSNAFFTKTTIRKSHDTPKLPSLMSSHRI